MINPGPNRQQASACAESPRAHTAAPSLRFHFAFSLMLALSAITATAQAQSLVIHTHAVHVGDGRVLNDATVVVTDGKVAAVGADVAVPPGATVVKVDGGCVSPGLIDANAIVEAVDLLPTPPPNPRGVFGAWIAGAGEREHGHAHAHERADPAGSDGVARLTDGRAAADERGFLPADRDTIDGQLSRQDAAARAEFVRTFIDGTGINPEAHDDVICPVCGGSQTQPFEAGVRSYYSWAEQSAEIIPHTRVLDAVHLRSPDFDRLLSGGVTTVFVSPDPASVIGSAGAIVRTGGPLADRVLSETGAVKAVIGSEPSWRGGNNRPPWFSNVTIFSRRPNNRMGLTWVFRKAFHDADRDARGVDVYGADVPPQEAMDALQAIRTGETPLRIQARMLHDITTACRLADEFGITFTLEEATDAYKCVDMLKSRGLSVIYGPIYEEADAPRAWTGETDDARLHTVRTLVEAGIPTALSAQERRDEDGLARQAMMAVRFGVAPEDALQLVTSAPAKMLGVADRLGTVEAGKQADLVVWSGPPLEATSKPVVVIVNGRIVLDRRSG